MLDPFAPDPDPDALTEHEREAARWHPDQGTLALAAAGAVAVETAHFNEHGGDRTQESFKDSRESLNEISAAHGVGKETIVRAKAIAEAAED